MYLDGDLLLSLRELEGILGLITWYCLIDLLMGYRYHSEVALSRTKNGKKSCFQIMQRRYNHIFYLYSISQLQTITYAHLANASKYWLLILSAMLLGDGMLIRTCIWHGVVLLFVSSWSNWKNIKAINLAIYILRRKKFKRLTYGICRCRMPVWGIVFPVWICQNFITLQFTHKIPIHPCVASSC